MELPINIAMLGHWKVSDPAAFRKLRDEKMKRDGVEERRPTSVEKPGVSISVPCVMTAGQQIEP